MNILITGGGGFLGARLARALLARGSFSLRGAPARPVESIVLADRGYKGATPACGARLILSHTRKLPAKLK